MTSVGDGARSDASLAGRFRASVISYGLRQFAVLALGLGSNLVLTRRLSPAQFGMVAVISVLMSIGLLLADGGFGVYLVQRRDEVTDRDIARVTEVQVRVAALLCLLCFTGAVIASALSPGQRLGWMVAAASLALPLLVVRGMSLIRLERSLRMDRVVRVEILEETVYAAVAIGAAFSGAGAWSVVLAQLCRALVGAGAGAWLGGFRLQRTRVAWDEDLARGLRFGLHYQSAQLINLARVAVVPLYIVPVLGLGAGGFVERSWFICALPLTIISAVQQRTMFPYVSRIQADVEKVRRFTEDAVHASALLATFMFLPLVVFPRELVLRVLGPQWAPMLPLVYWLLVGNVAFGALPGPLYAVANGIGKASYLSRLNVYTLVASWLLIVGCTQVFGVPGVGIAGLVLWGGLGILRAMLRRDLGPFHFFRQMVKPLAGLAFAWGTTYLLMRVAGGRPASLWGVACWTLVALALYVGGVVAVDGKRIAALWTKFRGEPGQSSTAAPLMP